MVEGVRAWGWSKGSVGEGTYAHACTHATLLLSHTHVTHAHLEGPSSQFRMHSREDVLQFLGLAGLAGVGHHLMRKEDEFLSVNEVRIKTRLYPERISG